MTSTVSDSPSAAIALQQTLYRSANPTRRYLHRVRRAWVQRAVAAVTCADTEWALEVGPGSGEYLPLLAANSQHVVALDIDPQFLQLARQRAEDAQVLCINADINHCGLSDASVDLILCSEVIEHLEQSQGALNAMARLLRNDGRLILTTPQRFSLLELVARIALLPGFIQLTRGIYREPVEPTGHINLLTRGQLQAQLRAAGLEVEQRHLCGCYLPVLAEFGGNWGARLLQKLDRYLARSSLRGLLWTQCYVLRKAVPPQ